MAQLKIKFLLQFCAAIALLITSSACNPLSDTETGSLLGTNFQPGLAASGASPSPTVVDTNPVLSASWTPKFSSLVGYWHFDEASGSSTFADSSSAGNTLACSSALVYGSYPCPISGVSGKMGTGTNFNGGMGLSAATTSLYAFDSTTPFTLAIWVKTTAGGSSLDAQELMNKVSVSDFYRGYELAITPAGNAAFGIAFNAFNHEGMFVNAPTTCNDGAWHYIVGAYDGTGTAAGVKLYVDGVDQSTIVEDLTPVTLPSFALNSYFTIGNRPNQGRTGTDGLLDEPAIWSAALTQSEVQLIYNRQLVAH